MAQMIAKSQYFAGPKILAKLEQQLKKRFHAEQ